MPILKKEAEKIRQETAKEIFILASKIAKRDAWNVDGFPAALEQEWLLNESYSGRKNASQSRK